MRKLKQYTYAHFKNNQISKGTILVAKYPKIEPILGGFQKSYVIFGGGVSKYLLFLTGVGGKSREGPKHPYVI